MFFLVKKKANWDKMLLSTTIPYQVRKKYFLFCLFLNLNKIIVKIWDKLYISPPPNWKLHHYIYIRFSEFLQKWHGEINCDWKEDCHLPQIIYRCYYLDEICNGILHWITCQVKLRFASTPAHTICDPESAYTKKSEWRLLHSKKKSILLEGNVLFPILTFNCLLNSSQSSIGCVDVQSEVVKLFLSKALVLYFLFTEFFWQVLKSK